MWIAMPKIPKSDRLEWLLTNFTPGQTRNILEALFVDAYIEATGAACIPQAFGAHSCPQLGSDLAALKSQGRLNRVAVGLSGHEAGFPKWVYAYQLTKVGEIAREIALAEKLETVA